MTESAVPADSSAPSPPPDSSNVAVLAVLAGLRADVGALRSEMSQRDGRTDAQLTALRADVDDVKTWKIREEERREAQNRAVQRAEDNAAAALRTVSEATATWEAETSARKAHAEQVTAVLKKQDDELAAIKSQNGNQTEVLRQVQTSIHALAAAETERARLTAIETAVASELKKEQAKKKDADDLRWTRIDRLLKFWPVVAAAGGGLVWFIIHFLATQKPPIP